MAEAGQSFRGRGNGTTGSTGAYTGGGAKGNPKSFGQDYDSYMKDQEHRAEEAAQRRKQAREEFDRKNSQQRAEQDRARQQQEQRSAQSATRSGGSGFPGTSVAGSGGGNGNVEKLLREILNAIKGENTPGSKQEKEKRETTGKGVAVGVITANLIRDIVGLVGRIPNAKSGFDLVAPSLQVEGSALGGAAGLLFGQSAGGALFGKEVGSFYGSAISREIQSKTSLAKASARYRALSGENFGGANVAQFGVDNIEGAAFAGSMTKSSGGNIVSGNDLVMAIASKKIADLDDSLIMAMEKQSRTTGKGFSRRSSELLGIAKKLGIRSGLYADVFSQSSSMTDLIAATGANPNTSAISQTMFGLNNIGGAFAIGSPTAAINQQALAKGVSNPTSPLAQAMMYNILRKKNPNADFFDLQVMQENAANDPTIMKDFLGQMDLGGGKNSSLYKSLLYNNFGQYGMSKTSVKQLAEAGFNPEMMTGEMGLGSMSAAAAKLTPRLESQEAQATNAFLISFSEGIDTLAKQWVEQMKNANEMIATDLAKRAKSVLPGSGLQEGEGVNDAIVNALPFLDGIIKRTPRKK